jgi:orotate phosphoribosyltransferase
MSRKDEVRRQALDNLKQFHVLMLDGHFDYGNGLHGRLYLNPHKLFQYPSTIWRFAQDLLDVLPDSIAKQTDVVAGPVMGGALLAHTIAGLLDGRRSLTHPPCSFAPFTEDQGQLALRSFYADVMGGKRVLLADDVRNTGKTLERCKALVETAGGTVIATVVIYDRMEAPGDLGVPGIALAEYTSSENYPASECPMCTAGVPITVF